MIGIPASRNSFFVALKHAFKGRVAFDVPVAVDGRPNLLGTEETPGGQQADHQIELPFGLALRHFPPFWTLPAYTCAGFPESRHHERYRGARDQMA